MDPQSDTRSDRPRGYRHTSLIEFFGSLAQRPARGALPTLRAAVDPQARGGDYFGPGGFFELRGLPKKVGTTRAAKNELDARRLWHLSEKLTGVSFLSQDTVAIA